MREELPNDILLQPCPFCNSDAKLYAETDDRIDYRLGMHFKFYVECGNDICPVSPRTMSEYDIYKPAGECIKSAAKHWNAIEGGKYERKTEERE